jgi:hypothetical protein
MLMTAPIDECTNDRRAERSRAPDALFMFLLRLSLAERRQKEKNLGGQPNPLKTLVSAKGIQGNQSFSLGFSWAALGLAWLDLVRFGGDLGEIWINTQVLR